ncbi:efflux transporter outer membrane subunit [Stakelama tenebrarum]|uniref:TolC family protein n=1 Tax=Stakelama tenebrarum TaxID=2711215 RepID=A0A6G6Y897_9SPHN|nr:TolC family protein [Sphingosinithalassobacter tenebrarum]QIG81071.1 TolC family protein [Sphingosinithalassobacter tenebrarum]
MTRQLFSIALGLGLTACAAGPDYAPPKLPAPAGASFVSIAPDTDPEADPEAEWWRIYQDPALNALVAQALAANTDLRVAMANLRAAEAVVAGAASRRLPQSELTANGTYGRSQPPLYLPGERFTFGGGLQLSYEADLFGRVSRTIEAARADAEAQAFAAAAVRVRVAAAVTQAYLSACTASEAITAIEDSIDLTSETVRIVRAQQDAGSAAKLDVDRAEAQLSEARAELAPMQDQRASALFELAALLGLSPAMVPEDAARCGSTPDPHHPIAIGDGASLLQRRPDVAEAERRLAAATARIGVATADLYPSVSIGASVMQSGGEGISQSRGFSFGLGPLLSFSFPDTGAARSRIRQSEAEAEAALARFDGVVLTALKEVEQALSAYRAALARQAELKSAEAHAKSAFDLAGLRYRAGSIAYIDVIVAQSELVRLRLARIRADQAVSSARVDLFRALGSGWESVGESRADQLTARSRPSQ